MSLLDLASLVLAPTATKEGKVYSAIPDTGDGDMTFSRGSSATRVNSAGLIEKERGNLLLQSNSFDTTWTQVRADYTSGQTGYDGTSDAWQVECNANGYSGGYQNTSSINQVNCSSLYAKAGNVDYLFISTTQGSTNNAQYFNLTNGTLGSLVGTGIIDANIESVGNGWYRCSITMSPNASFGYFLFGLSDTDGNSAGAIGEYIYIQDAMLNEGLVAQSYIETTTTAVYEGITDDVPRVDYSGGGCPSLLLEPQRSNLFPQSEYFGGWNISGTITTNTATSPEGVRNASTFTTSAAGEDLRDNTNVTGTYTFSVFVKLVDVGGIRLRIDAATDANAYFDLSDGSVFSSDGIIEADAIDYGNNWWRVYMVANVTNTQKIQIFTTDGTTSYANGSVYLYGAQFELGSYSSSYIPTYSVSSTRVADSCSKTGISELIGQTEGTMFYEGSIDYEGTSNYVFLEVINGTDTTNTITLFLDRTNDNLSVFNSDAGGISTLRTGDNSNVNFKLAYAYKQNDYVCYIDGVQVYTRTSSANVPTGMNSVFIGQNRTGTEKGFANLTQAILFPTRLTNDQLEELTK